MGPDGATWREHEFEGGDGLRLFCRSLAPAAGAAEPRAVLGILHGYGDHSGRHRHVMEWMAARGVVCQAFDARGHGRSPGRRGFVDRWDRFPDDLAAFLDHLSRDDPHLAGLPRFLLGQSHGALVLAHAGTEDGLPGVAGCVFVSPYLGSAVQTPAHKLLLARAVDRLVPWLPVPAGVPADWMCADPAMLADTAADPLARRCATPRWFLGMLRAQEEATARAGAFRLPLFVAVGDDDRLADAVAARRFVEQAASERKEWRRYPAARHELLRDTGRERVLQDIHDWISAAAAG